MRLPKTNPTASEQDVSTVHDRNPRGTAEDRLWTTSCGADQPSLSLPLTSRWPPTHSIAATPITVIAERILGMALTSPRPVFRVAELSLEAMCSPRSSIFTRHATIQSGDQDGDDRENRGPVGDGLFGDLGERDDHDLS